MWRGLVGAINAAGCEHYPPPFGKACWLMMRTIRQQQIWVTLAPFAALAAFFAAWEVVVRVGGVDAFVLPAPSRVVGVLLAQPAFYAANAGVTAGETLVGFAVALAAGVLAALAVDASPLLRRAVYPLLIASQTVPVIAIAPLIIVWFGFGLAPKVVIIALYCFFPVAVSAIDGLRSADPDILNLLRSMGATRGQLLRLARWPAALPSLFSGVRIAATYAVAGAVVSEWLGASEGLGATMIRAQRGFAPDRVFAAIAAVVVLTLLLFLAVDRVARAAMPWLAATQETRKDTDA